MEVTRLAVATLTNWTSLGETPAPCSTSRDMTSLKPPTSWMPSFLPLRSLADLISGAAIITTLSLGAYVPIAFTGAPCWIAANSGSELVATTSSPPEMPPRSAPTPPSKLLISTSRPTSSKKPISLATYGGRWTMLGGVTAPPKTSCILSVGFVAGLVATGPGVVPAAAGAAAVVGAAAGGLAVAATAGPVVGGLVGA